MRSRTNRLQKVQARIEEAAEEGRIPPEARIIEKFDTKIARDGQKGDSPHSQLLSYAFSFVKFRDEHGLTLEKLISGENDAGDTFDGWINTHRKKKAEEEAETVLNPDLREKKRQFLQGLAAEDFNLNDIETAKPFVDVLHEDPSLIDKAERFLDELDDD